MDVSLENQQVCGLYIVKKVCDNLGHRVEIKIRKSKKEHEYQYYLRNKGRSIVYKMFAF